MDMNQYRVCLDAGHWGKYNRSPVVPAYYESEMNWKLHLLLMDELERFGIQTVLTRSDQAKDRNLIERGKASEGCDLFLSVHANAVDGKESVDYPLAIVQLSGSGDALGTVLAKVIENTIGTVQNGRIMKRKSSTGQEWYGVLRGAAAVGTVGMILEHSFYTNSRAAKWLLEEENLLKLAKVEAAAIAGWLAAGKPKGYTQTEFIRDVQAALGVSVDGVAGTETLSKTVTVSERVNRNHAVVKPIQKRLYALGYSVVGTADGIAGPKFTKAVKAFQKDNGCLCDGEITAGKTTWRKLLGVVA